MYKSNKDVLLKIRMLYLKHEKSVNVVKTKGYFSYHIGRFFVFKHILNLMTFYKYLKFSFSSKCILI